MISRRKILSRSRDDIDNFYGNDDDEDVWYEKDKLYKVIERAIKQHAVDF